MTTPGSLSLESVQRELGAEWAPGGETRVPVHYGDPRRERALLEEGCGLADLSSSDWLEMRGEDRHRFLNGLITADVRDLEGGESRYGLFATIKGRILADVTVVAHDDGFWLRLPAGRGDAIREHLVEHVITDRVEVEPCDDRGALLLLGAAAAACLKSALEDEQPLPEPGAHRPAVLGGTEVTVLAEPRLGLPGWSLWAGGDDLAALFRWLADREGIEPIGSEAVERLRIERGIPRFGRDFGLETFPQEVGLDGAVSYEKGCYLGQEVIARIHYRGGVQRQLVRLAGEGAELPAVGETLVLEGEEVGELTSRAVRSAEPGWVGLALVKSKAVEPGGVLALASEGTARVLGAAG